MRRVVAVLILALSTTACPEDAARTADEPPVEPVDMDTLAWFQEGRVVEYAGHRYVIVGPPVYEPLALTRVGEFEGTPLYTERAVADPPQRLFIPVGGGYWQMLERGEGVPPTDAPPPEGEDQPGTEGIAP